MVIAVAPSIITKFKTPNHNTRRFVDLAARREIKRIEIQQKGEMNIIIIEIYRLIVKIQKIVEE